MAIIKIIFIGGGDHENIVGSGKVLRPPTPCFHAARQLWLCPLLIKLFPPLVFWCTRWHYLSSIGEIEAVIKIIVKKWCQPFLDEKLLSYLHFSSILLPARGDFLPKFLFNPLLFISIVKRKKTCKYISHKQNPLHYLKGFHNWQICLMFLLHLKMNSI